MQRPYRQMLPQSHQDSGIEFRKESWNVGSGTELYPFVWSSIYSIFNNNILCRKGQEEEN